MTKPKRTAVGDSTDVVTPKQNGEPLHAADPRFAEKMGKADDIMRRYRDTLNTLAK